MLQIVPCNIDEACAFITQVHRHHTAPPGAKFAIAAALDEVVVGVALVGRPVSRRRDDGFTAEVTRLATDGTKNACSILYAAAWRAARAMGYRKIGTYILDTEPGTSLQAAGWILIGSTRGESWNVPSRPRVDKHPLQKKDSLGDDAMSIGTYLRHLRERRNLSLREMSQKTGIPHITLWRIERNLVDPLLGAHLFPIAKLHRQSVVTLLRNYLSQLNERKSHVRNTRNSL